MIDVLPDVEPLPPSSPEHTIGWGWSRDFVELKHIGPNDWRLDIDMGLDFKDEDRRFILLRSVLDLILKEQKRLWQLPDEEVTRLAKEQRERDSKLPQLQKIKPSQ